ncbi:MAG: hypothetical protein KBB94_02100 [Legionellaceae bacterium]|nr:hypothetical protein [Legionellaceae bacterium]MBP9774884.1 hypothetical protein [Legionellaceae bacterium]
MYYSSNDLEQLKLKPSDLEGLSEEEKIQKIRSQWMTLCIQAKDESEAHTYTHYYHLLISNYGSSHPINNYLEQQTVTVNHTTHDFAQREQIKKAYQDLLAEFSKLSTELEKQNFARLHANFLNLAQALEITQNSFDDFFAQYLYLQQKKTLQARIIELWRLQMIRIFGIEGLDDFQYRHALATGELRSILAKDKLFSPIKLLVALINSLILILTTSFDFILSYHPSLRIGFFFLLRHPLAILMVQLPKIAQILEMLACPTNQIIRPLCTYSRWSPQSISLLLSATTLAVLYGAFFTTMLAKLTALLPYIAWAFFAYYIYTIGKQCLAVFQQSFEAGLITTYVIIMMFIIQAYIGQALNSGQTLNSVQAPSVARQWLRMFSLFSLVTLLTKGPQNMTISLDMLPLPSPNQPIPETIRDTMHSRCTAHLSHRFFNTPKEAPAIPRGQIEENSSSVWGCLQY